MAFWKTGTDVDVDTTATATLGEIKEVLERLREDVQRSAVISGLMARPGGQSFEDIVRIADQFAAHKD